MTATERLRELLDERGVEWAAPDESWNQDSITYWKVGSIKWVAFESENGTLWLNCNSVTDLTPSQAIAATLGGEDTYTREDVEGAFVSGYSLGLDMFDSSKPDSEKGWNQNERNMDEEMEELGWVRKDAATLGAGTCHMEPVKDYPVGKRETFSFGCVCSECGSFFEYTSGRNWHFCPNCGRRVEVNE